MEPLQCDQEYKCLVITSDREAGPRSLYVGDSTNHTLQVSPRHESEMCL